VGEEIPNSEEGSETPTLATLNIRW